MPFLSCHIISVLRKRLVALLLVMTGISTIVASQPSPREYRIKSVFLFNFTQFVEWPSDAFESDDAPLVIGVFGADPFGSFLDETIHGELTQGHPLVVKRYESIDEIDNCHILFLASSDRQVTRRLLAALKGKPVLTVGDYDGFARMGGMIAFDEDKGKIALRINATPVSEARLVVSSKLLRLAEIIP